MLALAGEYLGCFSRIRKTACRRLLGLPVVGCAVGLFDRISSGSGWATFGGGDERNGRRHSQKQRGSLAAYWCADAAFLLSC